MRGVHLSALLALLSALVVTGLALAIARLAALSISYLSRGGINDSFMLELASRDGTLFTGLVIVAQDGLLGSAVLGVGAVLVSPRGAASASATS